METACALLKIGKTSFYEWRKKGEEDIEKGKTDSLFAEFLNAIKNADAYAEVQAIQNIQKAATPKSIPVLTRVIRKKDGTVIEETQWAKPEWQAAAWLLERRYGARWSKRTYVEDPEKPENLEDLTDEELKELALRRGL